MSSRPTTSLRTARRAIAACWSIMPRRAAPTVWSPTSTAISTWRCAPRAGRASRSTIPRARSWRSSPRAKSCRPTSGSAAARRAMCSTSPRARACTRSRWPRTAISCRTATERTAPRGRAPRSGPLLPVTRDAALSPTRPISVLTFSTLYPNREMPYHGIFVENRLRHLVASGEVASMVVAPVPWCPFASQMFGRYAAFARVPREEQRHGITVLHPRYALIPKVGMSSAPFLMYASLRDLFAQILRARFRFDLIDAHYCYPDGVAGVLLGRSLGKPVVMTARGTDVNLLSEYRIPRRLIRWAAVQAAGVIAVSEALRHRLIELGVPGSRVQVLRNGVDLELFAPQDRAAARRELGLDL